MGNLRFWLDDEEVVERDLSPTTTLLDYLRVHRRKTGTKEGCDEGDCGACTVVMLDPDHPGGAALRALNACLFLLPMAHGRRLYTVQGLARDGLHPAQQAMVEHLGSQCGYCTPGVVMTLVEACYRTDLDADWKLDDQLCGNLCRCTGYRPIRDAAKAVAGTCPDDHLGRALHDAKSTDRELAYTHGDQKFFQPVTLEGLFDVLEANPQHRFVSGATDLGLDVTKKGARFPCLVSLGAIPELRRIRSDDGVLTVGGAVRLADLEAASGDHLPVLARMLRYFGARQIKHGGTLGGNLCNASPIGDTPPVLLALDATVVATSRDGERRIPIDDFFVGYRQTALRPGEVLARVEIPIPGPDVKAAAYKVSKRRELDISAVAACFRVEVQDGVITTARLAYGGMAATPARATHAEQALIGSPWSAETFEQAAAWIDDDFTPLTDHRATAWYRTTVAANLLRGFFHETHTTAQPELPARHAGTLTPEVRP